MFPGNTRLPGRLLPQSHHLPLVILHEIHRNFPVPRLGEDAADMDRDTVRNPASVPILLPLEMHCLGGEFRIGHLPDDAERLRFGSAHAYKGGQEADATATP